MIESIPTKHIKVLLLIVVLAVNMLIVSSNVYAAACVARNGLGSVSRENISVRASGSYKVWLRMKASSVHGSAVGVEVTRPNNEPACLSVLGTSTSEYVWRSSNAVNLAQEGNRIRLVGYDPGVQVDRILLLPNDSNCTPDNVRANGKEPGDNCLASTPVTDPVPDPETPIPDPDPPVKDTKPPTIPTNINKKLTFEITKFKYVYKLNWTASNDNVLVQKYIVMRDGQKLGETDKNEFVDETELQANKKYNYSITAVDSSGLKSDPAKVSAEASCFLIWCWEK